LMGLSRSLNKNNGPVIVHCSAGIGRTGSFISVSNVLDEIRNEANKQPKPTEIPQVSPVKTLLKIRQERPGCIQTDDQLRFCYSAILDAVVTWPEVPENWKPKLPDPKLKQSDGIVLIEIESTKEEKEKEEKEKEGKKEKEEKKEKENDKSKDEKKEGDKKHDDKKSTPLEDV